MRWVGGWLALAGIAVFLAAAVSGSAHAGNGANFVVYDHYTGEKGETEIKLYNDLDRTGDGHRYIAQLLELEHALTDQWIVAAYLESHKERGDDWDLDGFRLETRYRLFDFGTPFNPVLYIEYVNKKEGALYLREALGRTDEEEGEEEDEDAREHELESKLILGHDFSERLRFGFNWINEVNLKSGNWEFGYATGLTYMLFEREGEHHSREFVVKEVQIGAELFGGLGDSVKGLALDGSKTEQYAGINEKNRIHQRRDVYAWRRFRANRRQPGRHIPGHDGLGVRVGFSSVRSSFENRVHARLGWACAGLLTAHGLVQSVS